MDIVKRLRSWVLPTLYDDTLDSMNEAANEIERLREALVMVRDADNDCHKDGLPTIPPMARAKIDKALGEKE
jgi:hypothetical protein